jgi:hypothetical protein
LKFVGLQQDLLLDFLHDLVAAGDGTTSGMDPLSPLICSQLNACSYITAVLREWGEMKVYTVSSWLCNSFPSSTAHFLTFTDAVFHIYIVEHFLDLRDV